MAKELVSFTDISCIVHVIMAQSMEISSDYSSGRFHLLSATHQVLRDP